MKKLISIVLMVLLVFSTSIQVMAATVQMDNQTHDYGEINTLPSEYSYGTLFWTDTTEIITLSENTASYYSTGAVSANQSWTYYGAKTGEMISVKVTNCSIDADGDFCDVIATINNIQPFAVEPNNNNLAAVFEGVDTGKNIAIEDIVRITFGISDYSGLIDFNFSSKYCSADFSMTYYKSGTNNVANIPYAATTIWDFDISIATQSNISDFADELFDGNEGMYMPNGTVYYDKSSTGYLVDTSEGIGVRTPSEVCPLNVNTIEKQTSCVAIQELSNATFNLTYSGRSCGIFYAFVSPYTYELDNPSKTVDKNIVYEMENFNYTISQYVPNNYYSDVLNFIEDAGGKYKSFVIQDKLNENLIVNGDITVINEIGVDVTSYFNIDTNNDNIVTASLKNEYLSNSDFYSHLYSVNIPVYIKEGTGLNTGVISNSATTIATNNNGAEELSASSVEVSLKYNVVINSQIDNGITYLDEGNKNSSATDTTIVNHNSSSKNTVYFQAADDYDIAQVLIDGEVVDINSIFCDDGLYSYTFTDNNINENIIHNVVVTTTLKDTSVIVNYIDEDGNAIADSETMSGKYFDEYTTEAKEIYGYELTATPTNAVGTMTENVIEVNYIYKLKDASVIAKYIDADTGKSLCDDEAIVGKVFDSYDTSSKSFYGYTLVSTPDNASGIMTEDTVEVVYYYTLNDASVITNYIDENGNTIDVSVTRTGKVGDNYTTEKKDIYGYEYLKVEGDTSGTLIDGTIEVNYIYSLKDAEVIVKYTDSEGNELADTETITGKVFDSYDTSSKEITGYSLTEQPTNASGTMTEDAITVTYVYELNPAYVTVNHLDDNGTAIADSETITGYYFDEYTTSYKPDIYGYEINIIPDNATGTMEQEQTVVNYIYTLKDTSVIVKYVDTDGNELADTETITGKVFDSYDTSSKEIPGYSLTEQPTNASGTMTEDAVTVIYVYAQDEEISEGTVKEDTTEDEETVVNADSEKKQMTSPNTGASSVKYILNILFAGIVILIFAVIRKKH